MRHRLKWQCPADPGIVRAMSVSSRTLDPELLLDQAAGLHRSGQFGQAERLYGQILAADAGHVEARYRLGLLRAEQGRMAEALELITATVKAKPDHLFALSAQALLLSQAGRLEEALVPLEQALKVDPDSVELNNNRGNVLYALDRFEDALASYDRALVQQPDFPQALSNRGAVLSRLGRLAEAVISFERSLAIRPGDIEVLWNLADAQMLLGRHADAIATYDKMIAIAPQYSDAHSRKIFLLDFMPALGFAEHQAARHKWYEACAKPFAVRIAPHQNMPDPSRRLVIGYVSGDFREHSASRTFGPVLQHHDHDQFEVICYSGVTAEDDRTRAFQALSDKWVAAYALSDDALAARIRADKVDILVDLSGHTHGQRLAVFARKPAPVQVTAWGHATGTGLRTVDYLFSDTVSVPEAARPLFAEAIYDLPCQITFEAAPYAPAVTELPALQRGAVTFGCLNRFGKVSAAVLQVWARILNAIPRSQLLLKDTALDEPELQAFVRETLAAEGVGPERIDVRGRTPRPEHLATFGEIDIALDPFPQNGGASSWEALWQGVPVVAKLGNTAPGRLSGAILSAVGLADWIVESDDDYVALAIARATDLAGLAALRRDLRAMISASPAGNPVLYARAVEVAYRTIWRRWCVAQSGDGKA